MNKIFLILTLMAINLHAQIDSEFLFYPKIKLGIMFPDVTSKYFKYELRVVKPNLCIGILVASKDLFIIDNASINFEFEISYGTASTGDVEYESKTSEWENTSLPIISWIKLKTDGNIVPYIRIGIGSERTQFKLTDGNYPEDSYDLKEWFFCWGVGAGIELNYWSPIQLSIFVDSVIKERNIKSIFLDGRNGVTFSGITLGYKF